MNGMKKYLISMMMLAALLLLPSCIYDAIDPATDPSAENYALSLTVELPVIGDTRAGNDFEQYEDYVDPSKIRLLFFTAQETSSDDDSASKDTTLIREFASSELSFIPIDLSRYSKQWHVRIPVNSSRDAEFIKAIRENDFKIAVLANWPETLGEDKPFLTSGESIDKLHHLADDGVYSDDAKNKGVYSILFNKSYGTSMGLKTDWVVEDKQSYEDEDVLKTEKNSGYEFNIGVAPTEKQPIPMYGIQKFGALKDVWKEGTVFDLSNFDRMTPSYKYSDICLLRSVAKVELLIPASMGPKEVFLRNANRSARCEPVDVTTNTKDIWFDTDANASKHDSKCEWSELVKMQRTPFYDPKGSLESYPKALAWYYGRWSHVAEKLGADVDTDTDADTDADPGYPHILNPMIDRSDFTRFLETEEEAQYKRYVLYVPEKFVDDPETAGDPTSDPKVCHIEFRVSGDPVEDLDDDNCYRIYFVKDGMTEVVKKIDFTKDESGIVKNWENVYEKNPDNLKEHWPIMRNHWYKFVVADANSWYLNVEVQILAWKKQEFTVSW